MKDLKDLDSLRWIKKIKFLCFDVDGTLYRNVSNYEFGVLEPDPAPFLKVLVCARFWFEEKIKKRIYPSL